MDRFFLTLLAVMFVVLASVVGYQYFSAADQPGQEILTTDVTASDSAGESGAMSDPLTGTLDLGDASVTLPNESIMATPEPTPVEVTWSPPNPGRLLRVEYPGFEVVYSETLGNPLAVQYAMVNGARPKRYNEPGKVKTPDEKLIEVAGYAAADMALKESISLYFGAAAGKNTQRMTNLSAMNPPILTSLWGQFAALEKQWAGASGWIEVVAGPIFDSPPYETNGLVVPGAFYRAYRRSYGDTLAFIIPQSATILDLDEYLTSIDAVEAASGMAIFTNTVTGDDRLKVAEKVW